jgi:hypothetical protein
MSNNDLDAIIAQLQELLTWQDGWNSYDALAPKPGNVTRAAHWITEVYQHIASQNLQWIAPNITAGGDGQVVFNWRYEHRKLDVYIDAGAIEYLQVHDKSINAPITDGDIKNIDDFMKVWQWLLGSTKETM